MRLTFSMESDCAKKHKTPFLESEAGLEVLRNKLTDNNHFLRGSESKKTPKFQTPFQE